VNSRHGNDHAIWLASLLVLLVGAGLTTFGVATMVVLLALLH